MMHNFLTEKESVFRFLPFDFLKFSSSISRPKSLSLQNLLTHLLDGVISGKKKSGALLGFFRRSLILEVRIKDRSNFQTNGGTFNRERLIWPKFENFDRSPFAIFLGRFLFLKLELGTGVIFRQIKVCLTEIICPEFENSDRNNSGKIAKKINMF